MTKTALDLVNLQAEDEGLWFDAETAPEAYLQHELRKLHDAVEKNTNTLRKAVEGMKVEIEPLGDVFDLTEDDILETAVNRTHNAALDAVLDIIGGRDG